MITLYTVEAPYAGLVIATTSITQARAVALEHAARMTAKGGATGHVLIEYWENGEKVDTTHVYDN